MTDNKLMAVQERTVETNKSIIAQMAEQQGISPSVYQNILMQTIMPQKSSYGGSYSNEQFAAFLLIAKKYNLNPITKEIYAFPSAGGIQPIVSIDGWVKLINQHPQYDGMEFIDHKDAVGELEAIECRIYRKDTNHPICVTEYMEECSRKNEKTKNGGPASIPWQKWPRRMLRHKAAIQAARYAFGFAGITDPDEAERMPMTQTSIPATNPLNITAEEINGEEQNPATATPVAPTFPTENMIIYAESILDVLNSTDSLDEQSKEIERLNANLNDIVKTKKEREFIATIANYARRAINGEINIVDAEKVIRAKMV